MIRPKPQDAERYIEITVRMRLYGSTLHADDLVASVERRLRTEHGDRVLSVDESVYDS